MDNKLNDRFNEVIDNKQVGKKIRDQRKKLKYSREKLAELTNLSTNFLGQIERGERNFSTETMVKLSETLNISIDYLLKKTALENDADRFELILLIDRFDAKQIKIMLDLAKSLQENYSL